MKIEVINNGKSVKIEDDARVESSIRYHHQNLMDVLEKVFELTNKEI